MFPQDMPATWKKSFSVGTDPEDFVYRLGNLTLLTNRVNRQIADRSFKDKKLEAFDLSKLPINEFFRTLQQWSDKEIEARQEALAKLAIDVWQL